MTQRRLLVTSPLAAAAILALQGCTIPIEVRTTPPGATVIANGEVIGTTPLEIDPEELFPARFKGYQWEREGTLELTRVGCESALLPVDNELVKRSIRVKLECEPGAAAVLPSATVSSAAPQTSAATAEKLRQLDELRSEGLISEQEYQRLRQRVLDRF